MKPLEFGAPVPWDDIEDECEGVPAHEIEATPHPAALGIMQRPQAGLPPGTRALWLALAAEFELPMGAWGDKAHRARRSCHNSGRAIDIMTSDPKKHQAIVVWALRNRARYGITLIISRRRKWSEASGWRPVPYRGANPHNDHPHLTCQCKG